MYDEFIGSTQAVAEFLLMPLTLFWAVITVVAVMMACVVLSRFLPAKEY